MAQLQPGTRVQAVGLTKRKELNGRTGTIRRFLVEKDRWQVALDGASPGNDLLVRIANLQLYPPVEGEHDVDPATSISQGKADTCFILQNTPEQGRSMVAKHNIKRGEVIISEEPVLEIENKDLQHDEEMFLYLRDELQLKDCQSKGDPQFRGIVLTNSFNRADGVVALFHQISFFNHSCTANAALEVVADHFEKGLPGRVRATRDIKRGEQLYIDYVSPHLPFAERQRQLKTRYNFTCRCDACCLPSAQRQQSDKRRAMIAPLSAGNPLEIAREVSLDDVDKILDALKAEGITCPIYFVNALIIGGFHLKNQGRLQEAMDSYMEAESYAGMYLGIDSPSLKLIQTWKISCQVDMLMRAGR